jgi:phage FluMu protein Com
MTSRGSWQEVRCPFCHKLLFEAMDFGGQVMIRIYCRCKRFLQVKEHCQVEVFQEQQPTKY